MIEATNGVGHIRGMTELAKEALRLAPDERLRLIEEVWSSFVENESSLPVTAGQMQELERRRQRYDADPSSLTDWEELKKRVLDGRRHDH